MMRLAEDFTTQDERQAIERVMKSDSIRFDHLVALSKLDPKSDFTFSILQSLNMCGADLRGFNFEGSDLRNCVKDDNTIIDDSTIFKGAKLGWIDIENLPIVQQMQEVEAASGSKAKQESLRKLISKHGTTHHVVTYMIGAATRARTLEEFVDYLLFIPAEIDADQAISLEKSASKLINRKLASSKSRTRRDATAQFAVDSILERLQSSSDSMARTVLSNLSMTMADKSQSSFLSGIAHVSVDNLKSAFSNLRQKR